MKTAVCLLLELDGKYLVINRKNDKNKWGMPGGKVDPDESNLEAIQRETLEETGIFGGMMDFLPLYSGVCTGDVDYWTTTYWFTDPNIGDWIDNLLKPEEGLEVKFMERLDLCDPLISPFAEYNKEAFKALDAFKQ